MRKRQSYGRNYQGLDFCSTVPCIRQEKPLQISHPEPSREIHDIMKIGALKLPDI